MLSSDIPHRQNSYEDLLLEISAVRRVQGSRCRTGDRPLLWPVLPPLSTKGCAVLKVQEMSHRAFLSLGDLMLTLS